MRQRIARACLCGLGLLMIVDSIGANLLAAVPPQAPEIDGGSLATGLGLLAAGILILRARRRSK
jgi:hypothetical protein